MATLSNLDNNRFIAILYGKPKTGKTVLASQFPSPWFIDIDNGLGSVMTAKSNYNLNFDFDVTQITEDVTEDEDFIKLCGKSFARQDAWTKVKKIVSILMRKMPKDSTLVIDSLTRVSEYLIRWIQKTGNIKQLRIQDWGIFAEEMSYFFNLLLSSNSQCNCIVIAHETVNKDELTGAIERAIAVPGKTANTVPGLVDEFWYMTAETKGTKSNRKTVRILQTTNDRITNAGSRCWMPDIENPTYDKIKPYLEKSLGRKLPEATWTIPE